MKKMIVGLAAAMSLGGTAVAADIGVSISIGQPGFYGQIDIGDYPRPALIYSEPVVVRRAPGVVLAPVYLHVPPGQAKRWKTYCGRYNACGRPVYFVQDSWYNKVYVPRYQERHGHDDRRDRDDHDYDRGKEHGHGKDKGH